MKENFSISRCGFYFNVFVKKDTIVISMAGQDINGKPIKCVMKNPALKEDDRSICFYREWGIKECLRKYYCYKIAVQANALRDLKKINEEIYLVSKRKTDNALEHITRLGVNAKIDETQFMKVKVEYKE